MLRLRVLRNDEIIQVWVCASGEGGRGQSECGKQETTHPPTHTAFASVGLNSSVFIWTHSHQINSYQSTWPLLQKKADFWTKNNFNVIILLGELFRQSEKNDS